MAKIIGASKVTSKYQISIPQTVREFFKVKVGDTVAFVFEDGKVFLTTEAS